MTPQKTSEPTSLQLVGERASDALAREAELTAHLGKRIKIGFIFFSLGLLVAGLVLFASWNAIEPEPKAQTITVSINVAQERVQPVEPPPQVERVEMVRPAMAAPEILIQTPPSANAPIFVAAPPPPPAPPLSEKVAEAAPVTPPRFDAAYLKNPAPNYPNMSRRLREIGTVQLRVRVNAVGEPMEVLMAKSSGYGRLDESALAAVKKWKFQPATRGDTAIEACVLVPVEFSLKG